MAVKPDDPLSNFLLACLPEEDFKRFAAKLEPVPCKLGRVIYESGDRLEFAYFPTTVIISMLYVMQNGATAEIGVVGNDGVLGNAMILGGETTTSRAVVQSAGFAFKMKRADLEEEFRLGGKFQDLMLRYTQALMTQISQTAVCNRLHNIEQQFCRWLLISHDRLDSDRLVMTSVSAAKASPSPPKNSPPAA